MRVLSYNIHKGIGGSDRLYRLDRIVQVIEAHQPDIICLQEVDKNHKRSRFDDQPAKLAALLKSADHCYQLNVHQALGGYGNLVLSRFPISCKHQVSLRQGSRKPRGAQLMVVETPQGRLHVVNLHLGLLENERHWQVKHLLAHSLFKEHRDLPTLIIGDTNDWRNTLHKGVLAHHGFEHHSAPPLRFRSFPAYFPMGSLDKAFSSNLRINSAAVPRGGQARWASDHLPLIVDLTL